MSDRAGSVLTGAGEAAGMSSRTAITVNRARDEVQRHWAEAEHRHVDDAQAEVTFKDAPGDRGTEVHAEVSGSPLGRSPLPKVKDGLRRFKQRVETGEIPRSDGVPEGELAERKLKQRPAQPLSDSELEKAGAR
jgi:uncharacterized membrane protein